VEFPEGTDGATIQNAMRRFSAPDPKQAAPSPSTAPQGPAPNANVNPIADVAKSAGIGLAQGAIGLPGLPGNLEALGRMGIDKAATALGYEDPGLSKRTLLPTSADIQSGIEKYTGPFYQPQTTAGEYARTVGEFAPLAAFGPGGAAARAANVVAPAVVSETAGQVTKGTAAEPWARAAGGLIGGALPNAAMRAVTPITNDAARAAQVALLEQNGVNALTAGQRTGNSALRWAESAAGDVPFNGGRAKAINDQAATQFTRAALRRAGINADRATGDVIDAGFDNLGSQFDNLAQRNNMNVDQRLGTQVRMALRDYDQATPPALRSPVVENLVNDIGNRVGTPMSGADYQAWRSQIERIRRGAQVNNPHLADALGDVRDALDDAMTRSSGPADQAAWRQIRGQYRDLLAIEKAASGAGENTANGLISPSQLRTAVKSQSTRAYVRGQRDLGNLARAGEGIIKPLPNSGTAPRIAAQTIFDMISAGGGAALGGPVGAAVGAVAPAVTRGLAARALMSKPVQSYLSNQRLAPQIDAYQALAAYLRAPQAAALATQPQVGLVGGMGPRYDDNGNLLPGQ
jgi:hypothetical protein